MGCATRIEYVERPVYVTPPEALLKLCMIYDIEGDTVKAAIIQSSKNIESLELCNQDKATLKKWVESYK